MSLLLGACGFIVIGGLFSPHGGEAPQAAKGPHLHGLHEHGIHHGRPGHVTRKGL